MGINNSTIEKTGEIAAGLKGSGKSTGFENVKNIIADKLHNVAEALNEKAAGQGAQCGIAQYGKQASEWLDQSAEYVRQFDYEQKDGQVKDYVRQRAGRSLLIAGAVGLRIGAIVR
ncbi:MAG: hypothetical protein ACXW4U_17410, partial [Anaerolineales bacterium]